jgi:hypothetical protein
MTAHQATIKKMPPSSCGTDSQHVQDARRRTVEAIHKYGAEQLRIQPPSDRLTKAQQEISEFYRSQFKGQPSLSKAIQDLSSEKLKLGFLDLESLRSHSAVKIMPLDDSC